ncbi:patatin-like phospholipase domain-containing protein 4 isoform X2 [Equus przewalskii]|uniref:Patatin like phospholipase domain containing 4 n=2 Tax=Equus TaxID=9789 RepID=A0A3Q2LBH5_HORSE|nr:PREDICTED: patatin-like phospholipase domain-containing protein 4 isoform X1 [Equus przewalskii]
MKVVQGQRTRSFAARMKHINLSFAACGFLGIYHLGAASALCRHGKKLLKDVKAFAGASAGSLVASVLLTAPEKIEECNEFTYKFAEEVRRQSFGAVTPGYDFMARLRGGMESILPHNAHELAHNRLHVSITNTKTRENYLVSSFSSREDLIKVLLASSFVPIYAGLNPVEYRGQKWVDGGLTNSLPILPVGRTVTISPFSGRLDISPQDKGQLDLYVTIANQDIMYNRTSYPLVLQQQQKAHLVSDPTMRWKGDGPIYTGRSVPTGHCSPRRFSLCGSSTNSVGEVFRDIVGISAPGL